MSSWSPSSEHPALLACAGASLFPCPLLLGSTVTARVPLCLASLKDLRTRKVSQLHPHCALPLGHRPLVSTAALPSTPGQGPLCPPTAHVSSHKSPDLSLPCAGGTLSPSGRLWAPSVWLVALPHPRAPPKATITQDRRDDRQGRPQSPQR